MITKSYRKQVTRWLLNGGSTPRKHIRIRLEFDIENPATGDEEGEDCLMLDAADALSLDLMEKQDVRAIRLAGMKFGRRKLL